MGFEFGDPLTPTQQWADEWRREFAENFAGYIAAYRARVTEYWAELADEQPDAFRLLMPVDVVAVGTLAAVWIFARAAQTDSIRTVELWEHPEIDSHEFQAAPLGHAVERVRAIALGGDDRFVLVDRQRLTGHTSYTDHPFWLPPDHWLQSNNLADEDARAVDVRTALAAVASRRAPVDRESLARIRRELRTLEVTTDFAQRGRSFERLVVDLFTAHGGEVERGKLGHGEQVDVFVLRPFYAVVECRWQKSRLQPRALADLVAKLRRRPPLVAGLYVSMSGYTEAARAEADRIAADRTVILFDGEDVTELASGDTTLGDFWHARVSELVRRYPRRDRH